MSLGQNYTGTTKKIVIESGHPAPADGFGERTARGNLPDILHRRISAGHGDRQRTGALQFRGRGGKAGHRKSQSEASPCQELIRYIQRKRAAAGSPFLTF